MVKNTDPNTFVGHWIDANPTKVDPDSSTTQEVNVCTCKQITIINVSTNRFKVTQ